MEKNINEKDNPKKYFEQIEIVHQIKNLIEKKEYTWEKDGKKLLNNKIICSHIINTNAKRNEKRSNK